ncbi:haloacid dehalogenase-like hydrolase family protein [Melia azedarach]|uniref:Haloacid dehalogenase-like hydrolase family protein n=1 Tax=Melia azedarach TaxID=155640 RepID=A0ACC1X9U5_MELAZ|nr:haloacid dehalogenase-like hydrolase family protein [Melia azedarach]
MLPRLFPFIRTLPFSSSPMARLVARATSLPFSRTSTAITFVHSSLNLSFISYNSNHFDISCSSKSSIYGRRFHVLCRREEESGVRTSRKVLAAQRGYRKVRKRAAKSKEKQLELNVSICIEDELPDDPEILSIAELLRLNAPMLMKLAFDGLKDSTYKTRDTAIEDVGGCGSIELSVLLCNDEFIRKLNKEWRDEDHATDVLSMSQHVPELKLPILMLGDIVISVETAARQAEERGHSLLDEIRILMVHGLLHLLGFDHEISEEAETEMEKEEEFLLKSLGWKGKGLIQSAYDSETNANPHLENLDDRKKEGSLRFYKPKFSYIFCDMDGTLLNSQSQISFTTAKALKEALSRGVKVVIATGKTRPAAINILRTVDLAGRDGIISEFSPGVFLQGLLVYGRQGREIFRRNLDPDACREAYLYSWEHKVPVVAFSEDRCLTLFDHPLVDSLHSVYQEPKAEVIPSVEDLLAAADIQKLIFLDTADGVATTIRPYWSEATRDRANVVQAIPYMLEIVPPQTSKGRGVKILLDHLGINAKEIMAIGDGENDIEMLELASLGVALSNGAEKTKAVANVIGASNDEDGVADAIYRYAF